MLPVKEFDGLPGDTQWGILKPLVFINALAFGLIMFMYLAKWTAELYYTNVLLFIPFGALTVWMFHAMVWGVAKTFVSIRNAVRLYRKTLNNN